MITARRTPWFGLLLLIVVMAAGCTPIGPQGNAVAPVAAAEVAPEQYQIGPGDHLTVFVYEAQQLGVSALPVRPDGRLSLPLIPDIMAAGKTPSQLAREIADRMKEYVKDPNVSVMVNSFNGPLDRQIRVIGEATEPMALPYSNHMTVLDVMILTKGLTKFAAGNSAIIVRRNGDDRETIKLRLDDLIKSGDIDQNIEMRPGDTLIIPQTWF